MGHKWNVKWLQWAERQRDIWNAVSRCYRAKPVATSDMSDVSRKTDRSDIIPD
jgi:hypothetical protein